ncbi:hypothetical protein [uncultured Tenacibaculum sp.]|uniref:hypothetical protein n=1 Tax=uncultured Tenacibaculum sp. TaxID=174713 RepID=UPI002631D8A6|nr:hypothetical protein [uncultured Tenacibaculum sp.]
MSTTKHLTVSNSINASLNFNLISIINKKIAQEKENAIGISVILIMIGTMIASFSAALAVHGEVNILPLAFTCISAMGANAIAISQRAFKTVAWAFIINILGNILLIIYQLIL